jgi:PII-like signaling protein
MIKQLTQAIQLRIFINESDKSNGRPLYEEIVNRAHQQGMAGATVLRGVLGYGAGSHIHTSKILRLSENLPLVIEIVDNETNIEMFLSALNDVVGDGLVTLEKVQSTTYRLPKTD